MCVISVILLYKLMIILLSCMCGVGYSRLGYSRHLGREYPTRLSELGIRDLGIHDVGYRRSWVFRTRIINTVMAHLHSSRPEHMIFHLLVNIRSYTWDSAE